MAKCFFPQSLANAFAYIVANWNIHEAHDCVGLIFYHSIGFPHLSGFRNNPVASRNIEIRLFRHELKEWNIEMVYIRYTVYGTGIQFQ